MDKKDLLQQQIKKPSGTEMKTVMIKMQMYGSHVLYEGQESIDQVSRGENTILRIKTKDIKAEEDSLHGNLLAKVGRRAELS